MEIKKSRGQQLFKTDASPLVIPTTERFLSAPESVQSDVRRTDDDDDIVRRQIKLNRNKSIRSTKSRIGDLRQPRFTDRDKQPYNLKMDATTRLPFVVRRWRRAKPPSGRPRRAA